MKRVTGVFHYEMPGLGIWSNRELLGYEWSGQHRGRQIKLRLPKSEDDFGLGERDFSERALGGQKVEGPNGAADQIAVLQMLVEGEASFEAADFAEEPTPMAEAQSVIAELIEIADSFIHGFVHHVRVGLGQHWLGTSVDPPERTWIGTLFDHEGTRLPLGPRISTIAHVLDLNAALTRVSLREAARAAAQGERASLPEELLNDARFLAWIRQPNDLRLAVLLAAIACETKTKQTLQRRASPNQHHLLELILNSPRDVSVSTITHLDKTCGALVSRSLRVENKALWKAATALFEARNAIAHGREPQPDDDALRSGVRTAGEIFDWLNSLSVGH